MSTRYRPTTYLSHATQEDGSLILHSSRTGALGVVPAEDARTVRNALRRSACTEGPLEGILADLQQGGFLLEEGTDEEVLVHQQYLSKYTDDFLGLIIMPTEQCNFRCPYCYERFARETMPAQIREGIKRFVAGQRHLRHLDINWFGGEPLVAAEVVIELSRSFQEYCAAHDITYAAGMTTNGSLLTPEIVAQIVPLGVRLFQITLDGVREEHNTRRPLQGGGATFDTILANLRALRATDHVFHVMLRHNFDPESLATFGDFLALLQTEFGGDPRFTTLFAPIGKWGGPNDAILSVCDWQQTTAALTEAKRMGIEAGFRSGTPAEALGPNGFVCYAANPRSFVVGSDGQLYKCTVELDYHERNIVGRLHPDGTMTLDWRKMALWCETNGLDEGKKCGSCFFRPSCHGAVCPKQWMDRNDCGCPHDRRAIRHMLPLLVRESALPEPPSEGAGLQCASV